MIYFDNSATTQIWPEVLDTYNQVCQKIWGNPSSLHKVGETAWNLQEQARKQIADLFDVLPSEIVFTSGGSEGDNWVIKGTAIEKRQYGKHIITTSVEHAAVRNSMERLADLGFEITYLPVDDQGRIDPEDVRKALRPDTILVESMVVNNEIGTIQPIKEIGEILKDYPKVHFMLMRCRQSVRESMTLSFQIGSILRSFLVISSMHRAEPALYMPKPAASWLH